MWEKHKYYREKLSDTYTYYIALHTVKRRRHSKNEIVQQNSNRRTCQTKERDREKANQREGGTGNKERRYACVIGKCLAVCLITVAAIILRCYNWRHASIHWTSHTHIVRSIQNYTCVMYRPRPIIAHKDMCSGSRETDISEGPYGYTTALNLIVKQQSTWEAWGEAESRVYNLGSEMKNSVRRRERLREIGRIWAKELREREIYN